MDNSKSQKVLSPLRGLDEKPQPTDSEATAMKTFFKYLGAALLINLIADGILWLILRR